MQLRHFILSAAVGVSMLAGCKPDNQSSNGARPDAADTAPAPVPDPNPVDATGVIEQGNMGSPEKGALVDTRALAGRFSDDNSVLELLPDGTYVQTLQVAGSAVAAGGTWSAIGPAALLLDPSSKSAEDAVFFVASDNELNSEDGKLTFRRVVAP